MSQISSSRKVRSSWKISDTSRVYPSEESIRDLKSVLPDKFTPSKAAPRPSKIFTPSKEKLSILRGERSPRDPTLTPSKREVLALGSQVSLKESGQLGESRGRVGLERGVERGVELESRESLVLRGLESESPSPRRRGLHEPNYQLLKSQQDSNLQSIQQLRLDFFNFRAEVYTQLAHQRESIARIAAELAQKIQMARMPNNTAAPPASLNQKGVEENKLNVGEVVRQMEEVGSQFEAFSSQIVKKYSELKLDCIEGSPNVADPTELAECRTPISRVEGERAPERRNTPLDKCNQIAETIGILSEINSSPVNNRARSIERVTIEEYKQKLVAITRSNDQLMVREGRPQAAQGAQGSQGTQGQLKGNFKLDKFYNAIEKLKEEVNEIRSINDMKQVRKLRILQQE